MDYYSEFYGDPNDVLAALDWLNDGDWTTIRATPMSALPEGVLKWARPDGVAAHAHHVTARDDDTLRNYHRHVEESFPVTWQWMYFQPAPRRERA